MTKKSAAPQLPDPNKPKHAGGAPKKITAEIAGKIFTLIAAGLTEEKVAQVLDISTDTIWRAKKSAEFCGAIGRAKEEADAAVIGSLFQRAVGYSHPEEKVFLHEGKIVTHAGTKHYPPDSTAGIFWLTNRRREEWRREIQKEENREKDAPLVRVFSRITKKEAALIRATGDQVSVLLGDDYVLDVKKESDGHRRQD